MALVHRRAEILILACQLLTFELLRRWPLFLGVRHRRSLFCIRLRLYPIISTVKARTVSVHILAERIIDVGVVDNGLIHMRHSGVVLEGVSTPSSAPVPVSGVAITVINASVKTDRRSPVTLVKRVRAVVSNPTIPGSKADRPSAEGPRRLGPNNNRSNSRPSPSNPESRYVLRPDRPVARLPAEAEEPNRLRILPARTTSKVRQEMRRKLRNVISSCSCL